MFDTQLRTSYKSLHSFTYLHKKFGELSKTVLQIFMTACTLTLYCIDSKVRKFMQYTNISD